MIRGAPLADRFEASIYRCPMSGCWLWTGSINSKGYGRLKVGGRTTLSAHRLAWELRVGEPPHDLFVCHRCDVPCCVNPNHLFLGTGDENIRDMWLKRGRPDPDVTHCPDGHPYDYQNTYISPRGSKQCRICRSAISAAARAAKATGRPQREYPSRRIEYSCACGFIAHGGAGIASHRRACRP